MKRVAAIVHSGAYQPLCIEKGLRALQPQFRNSVSCEGRDRRCIVVGCSNNGLCTYFLHTSYYPGSNFAAILHLLSAHLVLSGQQFRRDCIPRCAETLNFFALAAPD